MIPRLALIAGIAAVAVAVAIAAVPRAETREDRVARIASELRCPVCQGLAVSDSQSDTARAMRALIEQRVAEGRTDVEIRDEFRRSYGEWVLLSPPLSDARGLVWLLPLLALAVGALFAAMRLRGPPPAVPSAGPDRIRALRDRALEETP